MRVLVAFEDEYRIYRDVIASAIRSLRAHVEVVAVADLGRLETQVAYFDPHLLISSKNSSRHVAILNSQQQHGRLSSWVGLSVEPDQPSLICIDGQYWESFNPSLQELLDIVEETELMLAGANQ